ncbi:hypothetical protein LTR85_009039 [Meristemomyces frigidus]|nr:hypothetical protein LTR85_009039 [Meristemomyces frigidus]
MPRTTWQKPSPRLPLELIYHVLAQALVRPDYGSPFSITPHNNETLRSYLANKNIYAEARKLVCKDGTWSSDVAFESQPVGPRQYRILSIPTWMKHNITMLRLDVHLASIENDSKVAFGGFLCKLSATCPALASLAVTFHVTSFLSREQRQCEVRIQVQSLQCTRCIIALAKLLPSSVGRRTFRLMEKDSGKVLSIKPMPARLYDDWDDLMNAAWDDGNTLVELQMAESE